MTGAFQTVLGGPSAGGMSSVGTPPPGAGGGAGSNCLIPASQAQLCSGDSGHPGNMGKQWVISTRVMAQDLAACLSRGGVLGSGRVNGHDGVLERRRFNSNNGAE